MSRSSSWSARRNARRIPFRRPVSKYRETSSRESLALMGPDFLAVFWAERSLPPTHSSIPAAVPARNAAANRPSVGLPANARTGLERNAFAARRPLALTWPKRWVEDSARRDCRNCNPSSGPRWQNLPLLARFWRFLRCGPRPATPRRRAPATTHSPQILCSAIAVSAHIPLIGEPSVHWSSVCYR